MKTLSVQEAQAFFSNLNSNCYVFSTENQQQYTYPSCMSMVTRYKEILISWLTNRICFKNGDDILCFSGVKYIKVDDAPNIGIPFYIVCNNKDKKSKENVFAFIADQH